MPQPQEAPERISLPVSARPKTTLADIRDQGTVPLWPTAAQVVGVGRSVAYEQARAGVIPTIRVGRKILVPVPALRRMLGDL